MSYFSPLRDELNKYLSPEQVKSVETAYQVAEQAHSEQTRLSGEPYITHPVAAAIILAEMRLDKESIMATLLHDVIEDTEIAKTTLAEQFGQEVAELVDGVSKLTQIKFQSRAEAQAENFRKMVLAMVQDIRVILVKLADRLHNMRTLGVLPQEKRKRIALETLEIYAPVANRLGMHNFYIELEDLGFRALYPLRSRALMKAVEKAHGQLQETFSEVEQRLQASLKEKHIVVHKIYGRKKHLYSIYKKMRQKHTSFSEIMDVFGFRIVTDSIDECYRILGVVHNLYKPLPERFKDYIAMSKSNGYQSLHTTLFGPHGIPIEIQIRTIAMHQVAENGIAAHWLYKSSDQVTDKVQLRARAWVKSLSEMQQSADTSLEFIESVKFDLFPDEVYVFTPKGDIMELPRGATPVDFAYGIHSAVGNHCIAVKLNKRLAPLSRELVNGDTVEIITSPGARPNATWLNFVVTGKARSNVRHYLKHQEKTDSATLGEQLLDKALSNFATQLVDIPAASLKTLCQTLNHKNQQDLFSAIGLGQEVSLVVAKRLIDLSSTDKTALKNQASQPLYIRGTEGMLVHFSTCCHPIPGDPIVGCMTLGRGIQVHIEQCKHVENFRHKPECFINMSWENEVEGDFKTDVKAEIMDKRGVLAELAGLIAKAGSNIYNIALGASDGQYKSVLLTLTVKDRLHLANVIRSIRTMKGTTRVVRIRND